VSRLRLLFVSGAVLGLSLLLLSLSACGGTVPAAPVGPAPQLHTHCRSAEPRFRQRRKCVQFHHHRDPGKWLYRQRQPFVQQHHRWHPGSQLFLQCVSDNALWHPQKTWQDAPPTWTTLVPGCTLIK
jgi:hypothetical protein